MAGRNCPTRSADFFPRLTGAGEEVFTAVLLPVAWRVRVAFDSFADWRAI